MTSLPKKSERGPTNIPSANPVECLVSLVHQHFRFEDVLAEIENPQWTRLGSAWGDWKQYIDEELRALWPQLGTEARLACYWMAKWQTEFEYSVT